MTEENNDQDTPKIIVDSDWKREASDEKSRLAEDTEDAHRRPQLPEPSLVEIINMIVMQATIGLGGVKSPTGETLPPDFAIAKHYIDLLELLKEKTAEGQTDDEKRLFDSVLHEMHMQYVHVVSSTPPPPKPQQQ